MTAQNFERVALTADVAKAKTLHLTDGNGDPVTTLCGRDVLPDASTRNVPADDRKVCRTCTARSITRTDAAPTEEEITTALVREYDQSVERVANAVEVAEQARGAITHAIAVAWVRARAAHVDRKSFTARMREVGVKSVGAICTHVERCGLTDAEIIATGGATVRRAYDLKRFYDARANLLTSEGTVRGYVGSNVPGVAERVSKVRATVERLTAPVEEESLSTAHIDETVGDSKRIAGECESILDMIARAAVTAAPADAQDDAPVDAPADAVVTVADDMTVAALTADVIARIQRLSTMAGVDWDSISAAVADAASMADIDA